MNVISFTKRVLQSIYLGLALTITSNVTTFAAQQQFHISRVPSMIASARDFASTNQVMFSHVLEIAEIAHFLGLRDLKAQMLPVRDEIMKGGAALNQSGINGGYEKLDVAGQKAFVMKHTLFTSDQVQNGVGTDYPFEPMPSQKGAVQTIFGLMNPGPYPKEMALVRRAMEATTGLILTENFPTFHPKDESHPDEFFDAMVRLANYTNLPVQWKAIGLMGHTSPNQSVNDAKKLLSSRSFNIDYHPDALDVSQEAAQKRLKTSIGTHFDSLEAAVKAIVENVMQRRNIRLAYPTNKIPQIYWRLAVDDLRAIVQPDVPLFALKSLDSEPYYSIKVAP